MGAYSVILRSRSSILRLEAMTLLLRASEVLLLEVLSKVAGERLGWKPLRIRTRFGIPV